MKNHTSLSSISSRLLAVIMPLALFSGCDFELPEPPDVPDPGDSMGEEGGEESGEESGEEGGDGDCEILLEECLDDAGMGMGIPEDACFEIFDECMGGHGGGCGEPPPGDGCEDAFFECLDAGEDPMLCEEALEICDPGEPPPDDGCEGMGCEPPPDDGCGGMGCDPAGP